MRSESCASPTFIFVAHSRPERKDTEGFPAAQHPKIQYRSVSEASIFMHEQIFV